MSGNLSLSHMLSFTNKYLCRPITDDILFQMARELKDFLTGKKMELGMHSEVPNVFIHSGSPFGGLEFLFIGDPETEEEWEREGLKVFSRVEFAEYKGKLYTHLPHDPHIKSYIL